MSDSLIQVVARPAELLTWSADTAEALPGARQAVREALEAAPGSLPELARGLRAGPPGPYRGMLVCDSAAAAIAALHRGRCAESRQPAVSRPAAFLLSGVGDQYPGLAAGLCASEPVFRGAVDRCCAILQAAGCDVRELLAAPPAPAPPPARDLRSMLAPRQLPQGPLATTRLGQPGVFVVEYALVQLLRSWGVEPAAMIGYSLGEYVAACVSGVMSLADALALVWWRAQRIEELPPGGLLAVALPAAQVRRWLGTELDVAAVTSPFQTVVGGLAAAVTALERRLAEAGVACQRVGARHGFHTRAMEPLAAPLTAWVRANVTLARPRIPYVSNVTGTWLTDAQATDPAYWAAHLSRPVELMSGLGALWRDADPVAIELGPGEGLCACARHHPDCDRSRLGRVQPGLAPAFAGGSERTGLLTALGRLWLAGLRVDWARFSNDERSDS